MDGDSFNYQKENTEIKFKTVELNKEGEVLIHSNPIPLLENVEQIRLLSKDLE